MSSAEGGREQRPRRVRLIRTRRGRLVGGVCSGLGAHFDVDPILFRIVFVGLAIFSGVGIALYLAILLLVPEEGASRAPIWLSRSSWLSVLGVVELVVAAEIALQAVGPTGHRGAWGFGVWIGRPATPGSPSRLVKRSQTCWPSALPCQGSRSALTVACSDQTLLTAPAVGVAVERGRARLEAPGWGPGGVIQDSVMAQITIRTKAKKKKAARTWTETEAEVRDRIYEPEEWATHETLIQVLREVPSVRGMVYGNVAEVQLWKWLEQQDGVTDLERDDDHDKTKADITFSWRGRRYTIQVKSIQTDKIKDGPQAGEFTAKVQCDASDKREITLPSGTKLVTTNYAAGEFMILATSLQPFAGEWGFGFRLNNTLEKSTYHGYSAEVRQHILKTLVDISYPVPHEVVPGVHWTTDLFGLLESNSDVGDVLDPGGDEHPYVATTPEGDEIVRNEVSGQLVIETPDGDEL